eukprot:1157362-Pelagomonas_calceolata.AAC.3
MKWWRACVDWLSSSVRTEGTLLGHSCLTEFLFERKCLMVKFEGGKYGKTCALRLQITGG